MDSGSMKAHALRMVTRCEVATMFYDNGGALIAPCSSESEGTEKGIRVWNGFLGLRS